MTGESSVLDQADRRDPVTQAILLQDLRALGLGQGDTVIVHSSLSKLGWVAGGAQAVILALIEAIGPEGTLVMPTHTAQLSEPSYWRNPPVPEHWWPILRAETPAFDPNLTVTRNMGIIPETFRKHPDALRSSHPLTSFAALGKRAPDVVRNHPLESGLGWESPLAKVHALDGKVLLLGVDHGNDTSLHLAEHKAEFPGKSFHVEGAPILANGKRVWQTFETMQVDDDDFRSLGENYHQSTGLETRGPVGWGEGRLTSQRAIVEFGIPWITHHRS